ncbi:hypothetical protein EDD21DRAFT_34498 [Dissophora ornata]|nr:hypothetical protein EDD21DRAFT_34498 [Dissophora ornata]
MSPCRTRALNANKGSPSPLLLLSSTFSLYSPSRGSKAHSKENLRTVAGNLSNNILKHFVGSLTLLFAFKFRIFSLLKQRKRILTKYSFDNIKPISCRVSRLARLCSKIEIENCSRGMSFVKAGRAVDCDIGLSVDGATEPKGMHNPPSTYGKSCQRPTSALSCPNCQTQSDLLLANMGRSEHSCCSRLWSSFYRTA